MCPLGCVAGREAAEEDHPGIAGTSRPSKALRKGREDQRAEGSWSAGGTRGKSKS